MKRWPARALMAVLATGLLAAPARAETPLPDPLEVLDDSFALFMEGDTEGYFSHVSEALRRAKQEDSLSADWGFIFGSFSDFVRNEQRNAAYALRLADEGLAYLAPHGAEVEGLKALLSTSRAYALADLGRYAEAVSLVRLAEPLFRLHMGDELAAQMLADAAEWERGLPSTANYSPIAIAREELALAQASLDQGEYGEALARATRAMLPEGSGLPEAEARVINALAGSMAGRALHAMDRKAQAIDILRRAAAEVLEDGWDEGRGGWRITPGPDARALGDLMFWLARSAVDTEHYWLVLPALDRAEGLMPALPDRVAVLHARAQFHQAIGTPAVAGVLFESAVRVARDGGAEDLALLAEFYLAIHRFVMGKGDAQALTDDLVAAGRRAIAAAAPGSVLNPSFLQSSVAGLLLETGRDAEALEFARAALADRLGRLAESTDRGIGRDGQRSQLRQLVEAFLRSAQAADSRLPGAVCPKDEALGCVVIVAFP